jgi:hypothetical protein
VIDKWIQEGKDKGYRKRGKNDKRLDTGRIGQGIQEAGDKR